MGKPLAGASVRNMCFISACKIKRKGYVLKGWKLCIFSTHALSLNKNESQLFGFCVRFYIFFLSVLRCTLATFDLTRSCSFSCFVYFHFSTFAVVDAAHHGEVSGWPPCTSPICCYGDQKPMKSKIVDKNKYNIVSQI